MKQKYFVPYNAEHGTNAVSIGRGSAPQYENNNVVDEGETSKTTRTGVGLGDGFTGTHDGYSSYSMSSSLSSVSSISSSSSSYSNSSSCSSCSSSFSSSSSYSSSCSSCSSSFSSSSSYSSSCSSSSSESPSPATIYVNVPFSRLRSGGNAGTTPQDYSITIESNQTLSAPPTLVAPVGTWQGTQFTGGPLNWTRSLRIHDDDTKGTFSWGALDAVNMYGMHTTEITGEDQYVVGGFVFRVLTVAAWPNRESAIGTTVANTAKLQCTNLSEGDSGDLNFSFEAVVQNSPDKYTITYPSGVYNATGNLWRNNDLANAVSNTSGSMRLELEEVV